MKKLTMISMVLAILLSCDLKDDVSANEENILLPNRDLLENEQNIQKWQLTQMTGSFINSTTTGEDMDWQEYIEFNLMESTFRKNRDRNGIIKEESGTFDIVEMYNENYVELTYIGISSLTASCSSDQKEYLRFIAKDVMVGTANACDGPGLEYVKVD